MGQTYKLIGAPCANRGPYTFYKAFKYTKNNITNILTINEFFFVKLWSNSDLISIGELRLLWEDKNCHQSLASLRLYILPENTPDGRISDIHGEDEVLAITERIVIRLEDLLTWISEASDWSWGLAAVCRKECTLNNEKSFLNGTDAVNGNHDNETDDYEDDRVNTLVDCTALDYADVNKEKMHLDEINWEVRVGVVVLSYARYCRYRGLIKRLEGVHNEWLRNKMIRALGGFTAFCRTTKILFCKDTFDYPELEGHELLCNHLAPKLRSRIPKKKKSLYPSPDITESDDSSSYSSDENDDRLSSSASSSISNYSRNSYAASRPVHAEKKPGPHSFPIDGSVQISTVNELKKQKAFIQNLYAFMRARLTPLGKLPVIGNQEMNLFEFYNKVKHLGGYSVVTHNKLWRYVFEELGGENVNATTAHIMKKHYEKFLLPYEQYITQQFRPSVSNLISMTKQISGPRHQQEMLASTGCYDVRRMIPSGSISSQALINKLATNGKPGDKENIPLKKALSAFSASQVIDLCTQDEAHSSRPQRASSSSVVEIIDLCGDSPIKCSVPSISATLFPKKRKLDILRQGGLEVTPISSSFDGIPEPDVVTITKTNTGDADSEGTDTSVEILNPRKYTSVAGCNCGDADANHNGRGSDSKLLTQVLDLSTIRSNGRLSNDSIIKKISPSLGPNIEISIVPIDDRPSETKRRKSAQMPVPGLRRISPGEISARNKQKSQGLMAAAHSRKTDDISFHSMKPQISITAAQDTSDRNSATAGNADMSHYAFFSMFYDHLTQEIMDERYKQTPMQTSDYQRLMNVLRNNSVSLDGDHEKYTTN